MLMIRLSTCNNAEPSTCFEASNAQTLTGRRGTSRQRLKTRDRMARTPRPACTKSAKGPRRRHSPGSGPASGALVEVGAAVGVLGVVVVVAMLVVLEAVEVLVLDEVEVDVDAGTVAVGDGGGRRGFWSSGGALSLPSSFVPNTVSSSGGISMHFLISCATTFCTYRAQS